MNEQALSSEHWGNHLSTIKNKTNHHPLFLSGQSKFQNPWDPPPPPALQNRKHHLQTHWNCWEPFSVSPWKLPDALWQGPSPTRTSYCFSLHMCTRPALGHGFSSALIARSSPCFLSVLKFPFNTLTGERNTHLTPSGFSPVFHQPVSWRQISTLHSLNATHPAAPNHPRTSWHTRIFTTKVLPILMLVCLDSVPSGSSLSRVARWNWVSLAYPRVWQLSPTIKPSIKGIRVPALWYSREESETKQNGFLGIIHPYQRERNI